MSSENDEMEGLNYIRSLATLNPGLYDNIMRTIDSAVAIPGGAGISQEYINHRLNEWGLKLKAWEEGRVADHGPHIYTPLQDLKEDLPPNTNLNSESGMGELKPLIRATGGVEKK